MQQVIAAHSASGGAAAIDGRDRFVPGQPDMWVFVLFEGLTFGAYFVVYMLYRMGNPQLFLHSQARLNPGFGVANTLVLLASSWFMARCVRSARRADYRAALVNLSLTAACGLLFIGSKIFEWSVKIHQGLTFSTNEFFWFYYFLTAIHVLHVLIGFVVLGVVMYQLAGPARRSQQIVETGATYWHMVDFLWVIIFALIYVMR
jgi:nitric oxide reductase NorE protein